MIRNYCLLGALLIAQWSLLAQDNTFYRKYNLSGMQGGLQLEATQDGGFVATGQHEGNGSAGSCDVYVYRVDACGNNLWFKLIGNGQTDGGKSIKEISDGGYIVAGHYNGGTGFLMRMNDAGDILWTKGYSNIQWVFYADETANGDFICLGHRDGLLFVFRTNSVGQVLWSKSINGMGGMGFYIAELPNGDFVFTSSFGVPGKDVAMGRISSNGDFIFGKAYGGNGWSDGDHTNWSCKGLVVDNGESIIITAPTYQGSGYEDVLLLKASTTDGSVIWSSAFGGSSSDQSRDIALHPLGYAIVGNTNSFPVSASSNPEALSQDMAERDILLLNVDFNGNLRWARTYGATGRDRGIGVRYNIDNGFTMSAFTNSGFFGSTDGSDAMDPVFIKTDSLGIVTCQINTPAVNQVLLNVNVNDVGGLSPYGISDFTLTPVISNYTPNDVYVCQSCYTEPIYEPSATIICVNEEVDFVNTTSVGLTCFQNWVIEGQSFSGELETITYAFDEPGVYDVELYSTCGNQDNTFITNIYVYETTVELDATSAYNGYEISCYGAQDGAISVSASGGYLPPGSAYDWHWNATVPSSPSISSLYAGEYTVIATDVIGCADTMVVELNEPPLLTMDVFPISDYNGFNISCTTFSDGEAIAIAQGGAGGYEYSWSSGSTSDVASNLSVGNYVCDITDVNGCETTDNITLTEPTPLQGQITLVSDYNGYEISCYNANDGQAVFNASGGVLPYQILWNNQAYMIGAVMTNLSEQLLSVAVIDDNGCEANFTSTIQQPPPLTLTTDVVSNYNGFDISCPNAADGQAVAMPAGGVPPYLYMWEDGSSQNVSTSNLAEGSYSVTVVDANGCIIQGETTLTDPEPIALNAQITTNYNGFNISCFQFEDGLATATASGAIPPYSYWWSNGSAGTTSGFIPAGPITAYVTDSQQCDTASVQLLLSQPSPIVLSQQSASNYNGFGVTCPDASDGWIDTEAAGGVSPYQYAWSSGSNASMISNVPADEYELTITDLNNCEESFEFNLSEPEPLSMIPQIIPDTCYKEVGSILLTPMGGAGGTIAQLDNTVFTDYMCCMLSNVYSIVLTDANNCTLQQLVEVPNIPGPNAAFSLSDSPYCSGQTPIDFNDQSEGDIVRWNWSLGNGERMFTENISYTYPEPGDYKVNLRVTDVNGCMDDTTAGITIFPDLRVFIPNAFTPNQDGDNEAFFPDGSSIASYDMTIFNRWGQVVFRSTPEMPKWNGSLNNANMSSLDEVYSYVINVYGNCESKEFVGHFVLIR